MHPRLQFVHRHVVSAAIVFIAAFVMGCSPSPESSHGYRGVLVRAAMVDEVRLASWRNESLQVVLALDDNPDADRDSQSKAARRLTAAGFDVEYWIEIARCPLLADAHPEWMCSLQGHDEWRRLFPNLSAPAADEVTKNYPWVPVLYEESFAAHLDRVTALLADLPEPKRIWLNDLQAGPSACGCGHPLCRWTGDYGPIRTATPLGDDAAAKFVSAIQEKYPAAEIVPLWATECEAEDEHESCGGVGCFEGVCWQAYTRQLMHLEKIAPRIGVQCFYKALGRDLPRYGETAGWIQYALKSFQVMPPQRGGDAIPNNRLIAVVQGWDVHGTERAAQLKMTYQTGCAGSLIATFPISHDWQPKAYNISLLKKQN